MTTIPTLRRTAALPLALGALLLLAGCKDGPTGPKPGVLTVSLTAPSADDRALVVTITGPEPVTAVESANPAYLVHSRTTGTSVRAAVFGALATGPLLRVSVADVNELSGYTATVTEVATASNGLREGAAGYTVTFAK